MQLKPLSEDDLLRILNEPEASLIKQYQALIAVEGINLDFTKDGVKEIAKVANRVNNELKILARGACILCLRNFGRSWF